MAGWRAGVQEEIRTLPSDSMYSAHLETVVFTFRKKRNIKNNSLNWYFLNFNDSEPVVRNILHIKPSTQAQTQTYRDYA